VTDAASPLVPYDEFGHFHENLAEFGLTAPLPPVVERREVAVADGRHVSALVWGDTAPRLVLIHGGGQNAHTWDTVALALGEPLVAIDLPGHGHSSPRDDHDYAPRTTVDDVASAVEALAPQAECIVGMSLGGLTAAVLAARHPRLVRRLMLVDVTPGVTSDKAKAITDFLNGPTSFPDLDALLQRTIEHNPTRSVSSLRRGILHNAHQQPDGTWRWRYDRLERMRDASDEEDRTATSSPIWDDVSAIRAPTMLVRGSLSPVVDDADVAELQRRLPGVVVEVVEGAGHSVQGDRPVELTALVRSFGLRD
jgi:pimeloyl-ACP methyl ester carboxylesterase